MTSPASGSAAAIRCKLTGVLRGTKTEAAIHARYRNGAVIGGTSAGAAVMSEIMITGDEREPGGDSTRHDVGLHDDRPQQHRHRLGLRVHQERDHRPTLSPPQARQPTDQPRPRARAAPRRRHRRVDGADRRTDRSVARRRRERRHHLRRALGEHHTDVVACTRRHEHALARSPRRLDVRLEDRHREAAVSSFLTWPSPRRSRSMVARSGSPTRTSRTSRARPSSPSSSSCSTTCPSRRARSPAFAIGRSCSSASSNGAEGEPFYQKRAPDKRPEWLRTVTLSFPSGRTAEELVVDDAAGLAWVVNLGCIELHPHAVRADDLDHPDELRIDLDPGPGVEWDDVRRVAMETKALLEDLGLRGWPKTSGSRGIHVNVRIEQRWSFTEVRRAALAFSREIERRVPTLATSKWWKEERHGVFLDYNQNAKDRTTCSAYSVRPLPDARVSAPLRWDEVPACEPADFTVFTVPQRFATIGDPHAEMDDARGSLDQLLELAARDEASGLGDAPWPPHFRKTKDEGTRVAPSRAKRKKDD